MQNVSKKQLILGELFVGKELETIENPPITLEQLKKYAQASNDHNPIHTNPEVAKSVGLDGVIAHGMLIMGILSKYVIGISSHVALVKTIAMRFQKQTFLNDVIICSGIISAIDGNEVTITLTATKSDHSVSGLGKVILVFNTR